MALIDFDGLSSNPSTPATNRVKLFARNDTMFFMDDTGNVFAMGGGVSRVAVTDINDPSPELNAISGVAAADVVIAYEPRGGADDSYTLYAWDPDPGGAENVPFTVDGIGSGRWLAVAGRFQSQSIESPVAENFIRFFFATFASLPDPASFHGMYAHVHDPSDELRGESAYYAHQATWRMLKDHNQDDEVTLTPGASVDIDFGKTGSTAFSFQNLTTDQSTVLTESNAIAGVTRTLRISSGAAGQEVTFPSSWEVFGSYDASGSENLILVTCVSPSVEEIQAGSPPAAAYVANITSRSRGRGRSQTGLGDSATGLLTINGGDPALLDIADREGQIENRTDLTNIFPESVAWTGLTGVVLPNLATAQFTNIYIVATSPGSGIGEVLLDNVPLTESAGRTRIYLGTAIHQGGVQIEQLLIIPILSYDTGNSVVDLFAELGDRNISGNVYSANGSNRLLNKSLGRVFGRQINITTAPLSPHIKDTASQVSISPYTYSRRDGVGGFIFSQEIDIDPDFFDDGSGTLAAVPAGQFTHQPIHFDPRSGVTIVEYGQDTHVTSNEAIDGINQDGFVFNGLINNIEITTWIIAPQGTGNLLSDAVFKLPLDHAVSPSGALIDHATTHELGGSDEITIEDLRTDSTDTNLSLSPDGSNGVEFTLNASLVREVFLPGTNYANLQGDFRVRTIGGTSDFNFTFSVPLDFDTLVTIEMIGISLGTNAAADIDLSSDYGAIGESPSAHSEANTTITYNITSGTIVALDVSSVFTSISAGDFCGINIDHNSIGSDIDYIGIRLRYTT